MACGLTKRFVMVSKSCAIPLAWEPHQLTFFRLESDTSSSTTTKKVQSIFPRLVCVPLSQLDRIVNPTVLGGLLEVFSIVARRCSLLRSFTYSQRLNVSAKICKVRQAKVRLRVAGDGNLCR